VEPERTQDFSQGNKEIVWDEQNMRWELNPLAWIEANGNS